ncbi:helix-turn-helix transcriptional regulator [Lactiplantibacillus plajomi]|uniref:Helix-turn-helix transcriptional regulator n=1 Tax=Lactiplantibacillus plajomi TaxID=1457217 RepID=A0ABV6K171_9LACO
MQNNVRALRVAAHLSQVELASAAGITRQTLSLIEKGAYNPSLKLCLNICYRLGQTLDQVFWVAPGDQ